MADALSSLKETKVQGKWMNAASILAKDSFMKTCSPEGTGLQLRLDVISTAR